MASNLAKIDLNLTEANSDSKSPVRDLSGFTRELKDDYKRLLLRFEKIGQVSSLVLIYSFVLAKRAFKSCYSSYNFVKGDFLIAYATCLFLSIKMVVDSEKWHAEDFETVSGISKSLILKTELFVFNNLIGFRLHVCPEEFRTNYEKISDQVDKRKSKKSAIKHVAPVRTAY